MCHIIVHMITNIYKFGSEMAKGMLADLIQFYLNKISLIKLICNSYAVKNSNHSLFLKNDNIGRVPHHS